MIRLLPYLLLFLTIIHIQIFLSTWTLPWIIWEWVPDIKPFTLECFNCTYLKQVFHKDQNQEISIETVQLSNLQTFLDLISCPQLRFLSRIITSFNYICLVFSNLEWSSSHVFSLPWPHCIWRVWAIYFVMSLNLTSLMFLHDDIQVMLGRDTAPLGCIKSEGTWCLPAPLLAVSTLSAWVRWSLGVSPL